MREGDALERLAKVKKVAFDKTGTLTCGTPKVVAAESISTEYASQQVYWLAACAEQLSEHPLGKAVVSSWRQDQSAALVPAEQFQMIVGRGVTATIKGVQVLAGTREMMESAGIEPSALPDVQVFLDSGCTIIYLAADKKLVGYLALSDTVRPESATMIRELKKAGVQPVLLTGDNPRAAGAIADQLKIGQLQAGCLPEDKLRYIQSSQQSGDAVCMIGDGINDAPASKAATVGIAMGGVGSDIAVDAADIALVNDDLKELPHLAALAKHMMKIIRLNLTFSMGLNMLAIVLAILKVLNPVTGALVHNEGSVLVIVNSALLLSFGKKQGWKEQ